MIPTSQIVSKCDGRPPSITIACRMMKEKKETKKLSCARHELYGSSAPDLKVH